MNVARRVAASAVAAAVMVMLAVGAGTAHAASGDRLLLHDDTGLVMAVGNGVNVVKDGDPVKLAPRSDADDPQQLWIISSTSSGIRFQLRKPISKNGTKVTGCLDLKTDVARNQQPDDELVVRECDNSNSQKWSKLAVPSSPGTPKFRLNNTLSAKSATSTGGVNSTVIQKPDTAITGGGFSATQIFRDQVM